MEGERIAGCISRAEHLDIEALEKVSRLESLQLQLRRNLIVNHRRGVAAQFLLHPEDLDKLLFEPRATGRSSEEMEIVGKDLPYLSVIPFDDPAILSRNPNVLQGNALGIEHPEDVMVGDDQQICRRSKRGLFLSKELRVDVPVRTDQRQVDDRVIELSGDRLLRGIGIEIPVLRKIPLFCHAIASSTSCEGLSPSNLPTHSQKSRPRIQLTVRSNRLRRACPYDQGRVQHDLLMTIHTTFDLLQKQPNCANAKFVTGNATGRQRRGH